MTSPSAPNVVEASHLVKTYVRGPEQVHALWDVSITLCPGELVVVLGPSGSGKTTLLNVLCGWERPDSGTIGWGARPGGPGRRWSVLAVLPQRLGLLDELSVWENVQLPMRVRGRTTADGSRRLKPLLKALGLQGVAQRHPTEISIGEQQRAALARAVVLLPTLLLADEPTGHQDEDWARVVLRVLRAVVDRGSTCLVATHNREAVRVADRVLVMRDGRIAQET